jgi:hypothetical protein
LAAEVVGPRNATAAGQVRERVKAPGMVPKTGPVPENVPGMVLATVQDPAVVPAAGPK